jgi:hypothetical protein
VPHIEYLVGHPPRLLSAGDPQWPMPLPAGRNPEAGDPCPVSYGDYFTAACDYLARDRIMVPGLTAGSKLCLNDVSKICIHLVKHGAFYHPARVIAVVEGVRLDLVLNMAVSPAGRKQMPVELKSLRTINRDLPENWVPRVFASGAGVAPGHTPFPIFVGQWFLDFHEVHRTLNEGSEQQWRVWDPDRGHWALDDRQAADFHRQAVRILTGCFDPYTLSAVLDWHHAAGDFVVRRRGAGLEVRLITVRRYAPLFQVDAGAYDAQMLLEALAAFWMRTSLWMRIDRIDGVGELVWADERLLAPMWEGFVQGLQLMVQRNGLPDLFMEAVQRFLAGHTDTDWRNLGAQIVARHPAGSPEAALIMQHLDRHAFATTAAAGAGIG